MTLELESVSSDWIVSWCYSTEFVGKTDLPKCEVSDCNDILEYELFLSDMSEGEEYEIGWFYVCSLHKEWFLAHCKGRED